MLLLVSIPLFLPNQMLMECMAKSLTFGSHLSRSLPVMISMMFGKPLMLGFVYCAQCPFWRMSVCVRVRLEPLLISMYRRDSIHTMTLSQQLRLLCLLPSLLSTNRLNKVKKKQKGGQPDPLSFKKRKEVSIHNLLQKLVTEKAINGRWSQPSRVRTGPSPAAASERALMVPVPSLFREHLWEKVPMPSLFREHR